MAASLVCKVDHQGDVRRFSVDEPLSVASISSTIFKVFNLQPESTLRLVYTDRDGDNISVSSDEDLLDARAASPNQGLIRLRLMVSAPEAEAVEETTRARCWCDNCNTTIRLSDVRFKCGNCANYDLCDACESLGCHDPTHVLLKLRPEAQATNGVLPTTKAILTFPLSQLAGGVAEPPPTGGPSPAGFDLNALFTNPAIATQAAQIASMASGLVSPKTQAGAAAPKPQLDLGALAGMATSIFGSAFSQQQQQQQPGPRAGASDLSNLFGALLAGANQTPSTNPAPAPTAETPETEDPTEDPLATLVQLGVPEDQAAQFLELAGGDVAAALNLFQQLEVD